MKRIPHFDSNEIRAATGGVSRFTLVQKKSSMIQERAEDEELSSITSVQRISEPPSDTGARPSAFSSKLPIDYLPSLPNEDEYEDEPVMMEATDNSSTNDLGQTRKVSKIESETFTTDLQNPNSILFTDDFEDSFSKELSTITISSNK